MAKAINDDVTIKGSTLIIGVKFPPVDDTYSFADLLNAGNIRVYYYIVNTSQKYEASSLYKILNSDDPNYNNVFALTIETKNLMPGVLMVECKATIPAHGSLPQRTEIARCSTGIAVIE